MPSWALANSTAIAARAFGAGGRLAGGLDALHVLLALLLGVLGALGRRQRVQQGLCLLLLGVDRGLVLGHLVAGLLQLLQVRRRQGLVLVQLALDLLRGLHRGRGVARHLGFAVACCRKESGAADSISCSELSTPPARYCAAARLPSEDCALVSCVCSAVIRAWIWLTLFCSEARFVAAWS